jgi:Kef-type K+ transport system membrane component KefB
VANHLTILCFLTGGAAVLPFLSRRLNVPSAVLEILYGIVLFNTVFTERPDWFLFMKELGFLYLMFVAGTELDLRTLFQDARVWWYALIPILSLLLTPLFFYLTNRPFYLGVALAMFSAGILFPVLKEVKLARSDFGRHVIGVALTGELFSIVALTGLDVYTRYGTSLLALFHLIKFFFLFGAAALALRVIYIIAWWNPEHVKKVMESNDPVEEGVRIALWIVFAGGLIAYGAQVEPITGSFIAGLMFTFVFRNKGRFEEKINALGFGFFIPFFFFGLGAEFDTSLLSSVPDTLAAFAMTAVIFLTNLPAVALGRFLAMDLRRSLAFGALLSAPLSMLVVAGALGVKMGLLDERTKSTLVLTALFASVLYPLLFRHLAGGDDGPEPARNERPDGSADG